MIKVLIWTISVEPSGWYDKKDKAVWQEKPTWYYISDRKIHSWGYAPGFWSAIWNYLVNIPKTLALQRWYRVHGKDDDNSRDEAPH